MARPHPALLDFGVKLRQLREDAGLSGRELAELLGWSPSKLSRIELGQQVTTTNEIAALAAAVGLPDDRAQGLIGELRTARAEYSTWRAQISASIANNQKAIYASDSTTTHLRAFEVAAIPGLLQTPDYARAVFQALITLHRLADDVDRAVASRLQRQAVLYEPGRMFQFLLAESAIRFTVGDGDVMRAQLDRLQTLAGLPNLELRILPFSAPAPRLLFNGFWIRDETTVEIETTSGQITLRDAVDIRHHIDLFDRMWTTAVGDSELRNLLGQAAREHDNPVANA